MCQVLEEFLHLGEFLWRASQLGCYCCVVASERILAQVVQDEGQMAPRAHVFRIEADRGFKGGASAGKVFECQT